MLSINTRKVLFSLVGIALVSFVAQLGLDLLIVSGILNITPYINSWIESIIAIVVTAFGILVGLMFESPGRARYFAKVESNPTLAARMEKAYRVVLVIGIIGGALYILGNFLVLAVLSNTTITITSVQRTSTIIGIVRYIALALVMLWLFAEPQKKTVPPTLNVKKLVLFTAIYCFIMAALTLFGLSLYRISDPITTFPQYSGIQTSTMLSISDSWETYTFPQNFSIQYPSTWTVITTSSIYMVISSVPTPETSNGVCEIFINAESNPQKKSLDQIVSKDSGGAKTTIATLAGLPALTATNLTTNRPNIIDDEIWALLPNTSIASMELTCQSNAVNSGIPVYESVLSTFKVL